MNEPVSLNPYRQRVRYHALRVETTPDSRCRVDVEVEWSPGKTIRGVGTGNATREGMVIAGSLATLNALQKVTRGLLDLDLRGAKLVRAFDSLVVIVALRGMVPDQRYDLIGSSATTSDAIAKGAVLAVLDATNRILELYANPDSDDGGTDD